MTITYKKIDDNQILVTENIETTTTISIENLKKQHAHLSSRLTEIKSQMNAIVDQLNGINADESLNITVTNIPTKE
jgi:phage shock protein A